MGAIERREREKENRIKVILDAAEKVFFSKGKDKASMDDVAKAAELSKGAIYHYFKGKEDIYAALNYRGLQILEKMFILALENKTTGFEKITALAESFINFYKQHYDYFNVLNYFAVNEIDIDENDAYAMKCHNKAKQTLTMFVTALVVGISDGSISSDVDPLKSAIVLWGEMTGVLTVMALKGERLEKDFNIKQNDILNHFLKMNMKILKP